MLFPHGGHFSGALLIFGGWRQDSKSQAPSGGLLGGCWGAGVFVVGLLDLCSPPGAAGALWDGQGVLQAALGPVLLLGVLAASGAPAGGLQARRAGGAPGWVVGAGG